jgi:CubicO group peptidase (beta-lactamase class C family)
VNLIKQPSVKSFTLGIFLMLVLAGVPFVGQAQRPEPAVSNASADKRFAQVAEMIKSGLEQRKLPSVSIAASQNGRVIWEESFGWADQQKQIKASPDTVYSLASTTKPMIATGLMTLVRKGKIDLDAPAERYMGPSHFTVYAGSANDVTVRRLLHHTAGLPQHFNYYYADEPDQPRALEDTIRRYGIIVWPPGETFCYANLGYATLGYIIARTSGRPLAEYMKSEVFQPLGMANTVFDPDPNQHPEIATRCDNKGNIVPFLRCDTPGAGHSYASVRDLLRFGMFHLKDHLPDQKPILADSAIDLMHTERDGAVHAGPVNESYGLGWFLGQSPNGLATVWHEGGWTGASAMLKLVPSRDVAVAVLVSKYDREFINQVTEEALRAMLPDYGSTEPQSAAQAKSPETPLVEIPAGTYAGEIHTLGRNIPISMEKKGTDLHVYLGDPASSPKSVFILPAMVPRAPGQFLGSIPGPIGDADSERYPDAVILDLRLVGDELKGTASASTWPDDPRMHFYLPYAVSLRRAASK